MYDVQPNCILYAKYGSMYDVRRKQYTEYTVYRTTYIERRTYHML